MKRRVLVIGIGAGNPDFVTVQAVNAMNRVDVFFIPDKGAEKTDLARVRQEIIDRHVRNPAFRTVEYQMPVRGSSAQGYQADVSAWHDELETTYAKLLVEQLDASQTGAFLVWGDPTLYDSTMRILERLSARADFDLEYEVLPGISSVQALAARHKVALNAIGRSVLISNGRPAAEGFPDNVDSIAVLLNADKVLRQADGDLDVYWGAYLGMAEEVLVSGRLKDVADEIARIRAQARETNGWIMDTLLMKKPERSKIAPVATVKRPPA